MSYKLDTNYNQIAFALEILKQLAEKPRKREELVDLLSPFVEAHGKSSDDMDIKQKLTRTIRKLRDCGIEIKSAASPSLRTGRVEFSRDSLYSTATGTSTLQLISLRGWAFSCVKSKRQRSFLGILLVTVALFGCAGFISNKRRNFQSMQKLARVLASIGWYISSSYTACH
jgi:hypothetical protein